jgi:trigger factor
LDEVPTLDPPTFKFLVPLDAEVELADYTELDFPYEPPEVGEEEINAEIEKLRSQHAERESVDRPAEEGDIVFMRISGKKVEVEDNDDDGVVFEERFSSAVIQPKENKDKSEWPFPGFSRKLLGVTKDKTKSSTYTFPKKHEDENLRGVKVKFTINVTNVQSQILPDLDDEFAKTASDFETLEELLEDTKNKLETQTQNDYDRDYNEGILDHLIEGSTLKYPPQMLEREKAEMLQALEYNLSQQGINKELYLQIRSQTEEDLDEEITPAAETRLKRGLIMLEVAAVENFQIDQDQLNAQARQTVQLLTSRMTPKEAKDFQQSEYLSNMVNSMVADMMTQKTMDYLRAVAQGQPWPPEDESEERERKEETDAVPVSEVDEGVGEEAESQSEIEEEVPQEEEKTPEDAETTPETEEDTPEDK